MIILSNDDINCAMNDTYDTQKIFVLAVKHLLAEAKKKKGIKQADLAEYIGSTPNNLSGFLNFHRNYSEAKRERISVFFNKTYMEMLDLGKQLIIIHDSLPIEKDHELKEITENQRFFCSGVKKLLSETKVRQNDLADIIGVTPQDLSLFLNLHKSYSDIKKEAISRFFGKTYLQLTELGKEISEEAANSSADYHNNNIMEHTLQTNDHALLVELKKELSDSLYRQIENLEFQRNYVHDQYKDMKQERDLYREDQRKIRKDLSKLICDYNDILIENEKCKVKIEHLQLEIKELKSKLSKE